MEGDRQMGKGRGGSKEQEGPEKSQGVAGGRRREGEGRFGEQGEG